jgi:hypothetical protein
MLYQSRRNDLGPHARGPVETAESREAPTARLSRTSGQGRLNLTLPWRVLGFGILFGVGSLRIAVGQAGWGDLLCAVLIGLPWLPLCDHLRKTGQPVSPGGCALSCLGLTCVEALTFLPALPFFAAMCLWGLAQGQGPSAESTGHFGARLSTWLLGCAAGLVLGPAIVDLAAHFVRVRRRR